VVLGITIFAVKKGMAWRQLNLSPYSADLRFANPPEVISFVMCKHFA
jgi:hypothetical protein